MVCIDKKIHFYVDERHSSKSNKDYYPLIIKIDDAEVYVGFILKSQYESLKSSN